ncbi:helix-turn-helix transcriptional regulator [Sulfitobacter sp. TSTF-M16]|uniref:Helix-turn-helix transcriptional regulator n=1 Tax=Sulfitobacter aestuariivivens TaxID=2766981 RepID=A0A927HET3_9RHOB|nr:helix-turn-helix transcriptional regulator [Sulfitobacter aestuariivivens]
MVSVLMTIAAYVLAWDTRVPGRSRFFLCGFLLCLVFVTVLLGMRVSLDWSWPARVQPFVAILAAPLAYIGFASLTLDRGKRWNSMLYRNGGFVAVALVGLLSPIPVSADLFILAVNCIYIVRIASLLSYSPDDFLSVPPHSTGLWRAAIYATLALIGLMVVADGLVFAISLVANDPQLLTLLTGVSGLFAGFVFVVALIGVPLILRASQRNVPARAEASDADHALMQALNEIMKDKELFRDSNLTLARLAKRLSVPARDLSGAINRTTTQNFSRFINGYRIAYAKGALLETDLPITEVMFEAGFLSKSSFNTEFRRMTGLTPSQFRIRGADG